MGKKVAVLTDSTASIPDNIMDELDIRTVAYYIHRGQEVLRDLVTIQREEFLQLMECSIQTLVAAVHDILFLEVSGDMHGAEGIDAGLAVIIVAA